MLNIFSGLLSDLELSVLDVQAAHAERLTVASHTPVKRRGRRARPTPKTALIAQAAAEKAVDDVHRGTFAAPELVA